jgi:hypothetical protein
MQVGWKGNSRFLDMCVLQVNRANGWTVLAFDPNPDYTDTMPFLATPIKGRYPAICRVGDNEIGPWRTTLETTVRR